MSSILNDYNVKFFVPEEYGKKYMTSINPWLSQFIGDHRTVDIVNAILVNINSVINGQLPEWVELSQSLEVASVKPNQTKIYKSADEWEQNNNIAPDFILPTSDFIVIVEAWRDYLQE